MIPSTTNRTLGTRGPEQLHKQSRRDKVCLRVSVLGEAPQLGPRARPLPPAPFQQHTRSTHGSPASAPLLGCAGRGRALPSGFQSGRRARGTRAATTAGSWPERNACPPALPKHPLPSYFPVYSSCRRRVREERITNQYSLLSFFFLLYINTQSVSCNFYGWGNQEQASQASHKTSLHGSETTAATSVSSSLSYSLRKFQSAFCRLQVCDLLS